MSRLALAALVACAVLEVRPASSASSDAWERAALYAIEYRVELTEIGARPGQSVRLWLPLPAETNDQRLISEKIESPWPVRISVDDLGNRIAYIEAGGAAKSPVVLDAVVERLPSEGLPKDQVRSGGADDPARYRDGARMIPLDGLIRAVAERESTGLTGDAEKIRAFYDFVIATMSYDKSGTGWGQGNAVWACSNKRGNCTDFHSLFIGMARSQGIPARFVIGLPIPDGDEGVIGGYHCWAEFWDETKGWRPVDTSEAKKRGLRDAYFGRLPNDRIEFTTGRDLVLRPPQAGKPLNYFIYPYAEIAGRPIERVPATFSFARLP